MTLIVDTAPIVALADAGDPRRGAVRDVLDSEPGPLVVPAPATAEIDYLRGKLFGSAARRDFITDLASGAYHVGALERDDYQTVLALEARYRGLELGLADCALVILAARHQTTRIVSFDERDLRAITPLYGGAFTILPADA